jgi:group I intron endonuclease
MRKRRSDRNHIIYTITNKITEEIYIGITAIQGKAVHRSLMARWKKHLSRSRNQDLDWNLYRSIEKHGESQFSIRLYEVIRGKSNAHKREVELIKLLNPTLNSTHNK